MVGVTLSTLDGKADISVAGVVEGFLEGFPEVTSNGRNEGVSDGFQECLAESNDCEEESFCGRKDWLPLYIGMIIAW